MPLHGNSRGLESSADAGDDTSNDQVGNVEGSGLQSGSDQDERHGYPYDLAAAKVLTHEEVY